MTQDEIISLMRQACDPDKVDAWNNDFWAITQPELERFANLIAAFEAGKRPVITEQAQPVAWMDEEKKLIYWHNTHETDDCHGFKRTIPLYTAPPAPVQQEPVAWRDHAFAKLGFVRDKMSESDVGAVQRFLEGNYTASSQRTQLTDEEVDRLMLENPAIAFTLMHSWNMPANEFRQALTKLARVVEQAHGIGGKYEH